MKTVLLAIAAILVSVTAAVAQDTYRIRAGDTLSVEVLEDPSLNRQLLVTPAGSISFPFTGAITVRARRLIKSPRNLLLQSPPTLPRRLTYLSR